MDETIIRSQIFRDMAAWKKELDAEEKANPRTPSPIGQIQVRGVDTHTITQRSIQAKPTEDQDNWRQSSPAFVCPIIDISLNLSGLLIDCACGISANFPTGFSVVVSGNIDGIYTLPYMGAGLNQIVLTAAVQIDHYDMCGGTLLDTVMADVEIDAQCPGIHGAGAFDLVAFTRGAYLVNLFAGNGSAANPQIISNILTCGGGGNFGHSGTGTITW